MFKSLNETRTEKTKRLKTIPMRHLKEVLASTIEQGKRLERDLPIEFTLQCLPLSTNMMSGRSKTFETKEYQEYRTQIAKVAGGIYGVQKSDKFELRVEVGFSSKRNDADNILKPLLDSITGCIDDAFDDSQVYHIEVDKLIVKKGQEYIKVYLGLWE